MTKIINIGPNDDENNNDGVDDDDERFSRRTLADTVTLICVLQCSQPSWVGSADSLSFARRLHCLLALWLVSLVSVISHLVPEPEGQSDVFVSDDLVNDAGGSRPDDSVPVDKSEDNSVIPKD